MYTQQQIFNFLNKKFPIIEKWKRIDSSKVNQLISESPEQIVKSILLCVTLPYKLKSNYDLVICHHPVFSSDIVFADIGGNHEQVESYAVTRSKDGKIDNDYNNAIFEHYPPDEMIGCYDEEDLKDYNYNDKVTAIGLYGM